VAACRYIFGATDLCRSAHAMAADSFVFGRLGCEARGRLHVGAYVATHQLWMLPCPTASLLTRLKPVGITAYSCSLDGISLLHLASPVPLDNLSTHSIGSGKAKASFRFKEGVRFLLCFRRWEAFRLQYACWSFSALLKALGGRDLQYMYRILSIYCVSQLLSPLR